MNNQCDYYISIGGFPQCTNNAEYMLIYYNIHENAAKSFFYCHGCYSDLKLKNMEYFNSPYSKIIHLEELKPKNANHSEMWLKFEKKQKIKPNTWTWIEGSFKDQIEIDSKEYEKLPEWMKNND